MRELTPPHRGDLEGGSGGWARAASIRVLVAGVRVPRVGSADSCCSCPYPGGVCRAGSVCGDGRVCGLPGVEKHPCSTTRIGVRVRAASAANGPGGRCQDWVTPPTSLTLTLIRTRCRMLPENILDAVRMRAVSIVITMTVCVTGPHDLGYLVAA